MVFIPLLEVRAWKNPSPFRVIHMHTWHGSILQSKSLMNSDFNPVESCTSLTKRSVLLFLTGLPEIPKISTTIPPQKPLIINDICIVLFIICAHAERGLSNDLIKGLVSFISSPATLWTYQFTWTCRTRIKVILVVDEKMRAEVLKLALSWLPIRARLNRFSQILSTYLRHV